MRRLRQTIDRSPVLRTFGAQVRSLRSRFYPEWRWNLPDQPEEISNYGRITPLQTPPGELLLEAPYGQNQWSKIGTGSPDKLIDLAWAPCPNRESEVNCIGSNAYHTGHLYVIRRSARLYDH